MLRKGFLHRDISVGNTLMLDPPVTMKPFETRIIEGLVERFPLQYRCELSRSTDLLERMIKEMGLVDKCCGFVIDGDMAAPLEGYFISRDARERSVSIPTIRTNLTDMACRGHTSSCQMSW